MNDSFWRWLTRRNPARFMIAAMALMAAAAAWWMLRHGTEAEPATPVGVRWPDDPEPAPAAAPTGLPAVASLPRADPFASGRLADLIREAEEQRAARRREEEARAARRRAEEEEARRLEQERLERAIAETPAPPAVSPPDPPPPPRTLQVLYRGMLVRPDGTVLGLVEDPSSLSTAFYRVGDRIAGHPVRHIAPRELRLGEDGGESLPLGEPVQIEDRSP